MNPLLAILFLLAALSMLATFRLTSHDFKMLRASALLSAVGYALASLFLGLHLLGLQSQLMSTLIVSMAMLFTAVGGISHALGLILERHYHLGDHRGKF